MADLIMLGTGCAMVTKCYNTCFAIETLGKGIFLVDAGGGSGIMAQIERAGIKWKDIRAIFLTHAHSDHVLGCIWVIRMINSLMKKGEYCRSFKIYATQENIDFLKYSCSFILNGSIDGNIVYVPVDGGSIFEECGISFEAADLQSEKKKQLGFKALIKEGGRRTVLFCNGDEPCTVHTEAYVKHADWLLHEAFCLYSEREIHKPYEKHHSTAADAAKIAQRLGVRNLVLYHTEDTDLDNRCARYTAEAEKNFSGKVYVPNDLERIELL